MKNKNSNLSIKTCTVCKETKDISCYHRSSCHGGGRYSVCKDCVRIRYRERRVKYPETFKRKERNYYFKHAQEIKIKHLARYHAEKYKFKAREAVKTALKKGLIKKSKQCLICGTSGLLEGHHKDYSKPLDVMWLCRRCHRRIDFGVNMSSSS